MFLLELRLNCQTNEFYTIITPWLKYEIGFMKNVQISITKLPLYAVTSGFECYYNTRTIIITIYPGLAQNSELYVL